MQNKGAIRLFAILLALVCVFQLSFTLVTTNVERKAKEFANSAEVNTLAKKLANGDALRERAVFDSLSSSKERYYYDSISSQPVYNLLVRKYTYKECKEREINLGLDLKGGMNVTMEVSVVDIIRALSNNNTNPNFLKALDNAQEMQKTSQEDLVSLFGKSFESLDKNGRLAAIFSTVELKDKINFNSTNEQVLKVLTEETTGAIDRTFNILRTRIDKFGVAQPNIQKLSTAGRILIELPGVKEPDRVRKLLQGTAKLEFWETYEYSEIYNVFAEVNTKLKDLITNKDSSKIKSDSTSAVDTITKNAAIDKLVAGKKADIKSTDKKKEEIKKEVADKKTEVKKDSSSLTDKIKKDTTKGGKGQQNMEQYSKDNPLFALLRPAVVQDEKGNYFPNKGPVSGYCEIKDTAKVNSYFRLKQVQTTLPRNLKLAWSVKPFDKEGKMLQLISLKVNSRDNKAPLEGDVIVDARQDFSQTGGNEVTMNMNSEGARIWKRLTSENIGKSVAIVLDNYVYSFPTVNDEIPNGRSSITGGFTLNEAKDLANVLKAGKLPAPARIVEEAIVGPTLGKEAINAGFLSFIIALILVLAFMVFYYSSAGWAANIALLANFFFIFGILASMGAVLTLPGIAGIVLTMGMAVDANIIIYERVREELALGKGMRLAVSDGFKHSYSAIIDGNLTTLLTGIVLYIFGSGPIQGFATTLVIGIFTTLFTAIFISRMWFEWRFSRNKSVAFFTKLTEGAFKKVNFGFIQARKKMYIISIAMFSIGVITLAVRGLDYGVDFTGGRTYVVRFAKDVTTQSVKDALAKPFAASPEVKTFGSNDQVKITTKFMIDNKTTSADSTVEKNLYSGLQSLLGNDITYPIFKEKYLMSSQKVGPTIASDMVKNAFLAVFFALIGIFLYILARFRNWQMALGGVSSLAHDAVITISMFSILRGLMPFSLEIDSAFIAAILTVIGYSINDTVIIFDRVREYRTMHKKQDLENIVNNALNSTLSRTINTVATVIFTLLAMFIFGGEVIRGFIFAMLFGVVIGTYSSLFVATPIFYDTFSWAAKRKEDKEAKLVSK